MYSRTPLAAALCAGIILVSGCGKKSGPTPLNGSQTPGAAPKQTETAPVKAQIEPEARLFVNGPKNCGKVALTFDAGADADAVSLILQTLEAHHVHCTFFLTGAFAARFPEQCKAISDAGMELGNHSYHHPKFTTKSAEQVHEELSTAEAEIEKVCGRPAKPLFRFPFGDSDKRVRALVAAEGYQAIHWTIDSLDSVGKPKDAEFVTKRILGKIKPGAITLMHVSRIESAKSLPAIFDYLDSQGIKVVPVSELVAADREARAARKAHSKTAKPTSSER